jgi:hypothetical protein
MAKNQPILSLCLPTNGAVHWVIPTLEGIYSQGVDTSLFEVVITDNGENSKLSDAIQQFDYPNLRYIQTNDSGFLNLITALKLGKGQYCKMLNHRGILVPGALQMMIDAVKHYSRNSPILYFSDGALGDADVIACANTDEFVRTMHYYATWSGGVGVWQKDLERLNGLLLNETFPQSALMFDIRPESEYVICNRKFQNMQDEEGKGGYDLFYAFAVEFPNIWRALLTQKRISTATFEYVMDKMYGFIYSLYCQEVLHKSKHTFIIQNVAKSIMENYGLKGYLRIVIEARVNQVKRKIKKLL